MIMMMMMIRTRDRRILWAASLRCPMVTAVLFRCRQLQLSEPIQRNGHSTPMKSWCQWLQRGRNITVPAVTNKWHSQGLGWGDGALLILVFVTTGSSIQNHLTDFD